MRTHLAVSIIALLAGVALWSCAGGSIPAKADVPGTEKKLSTRTLEAGAAMVQDKPPLDALNMYLDGFHFYADDMGHQVGARHYCAQLNEEFIQCVIYDGNTEDSKLVGVEYIVSERTFKSLPKDEKRLWHSHHYEVKSGQLVAPGVPDVAEHALMEKLVTTYGKTWHMWDTARHALPLGIPALMMGFTQDGQIRPELLQQRNQQIGISPQEKRQNRQDIPMPVVDPDASSWQSGTTHQLRLEDMPMRGAR